VIKCGKQLIVHWKSIVWSVIYIS